MLDKKKSLWYSIKAVSESDASESERALLRVIGL